MLTPYPRHNPAAAPMPRAQRTACTVLVLILATVSLILLGARMAAATTCTYGSDTRAVDVLPWDDETGGYLTLWHRVQWKRCGALYGRSMAVGFGPSTRPAGFGGAPRSLPCASLTSVEANMGAIGGRNPAGWVSACRRGGASIPYDYADWRTGADPCTTTTVKLVLPHQGDKRVTLPPVCAGR